jgi:hypothetical protein
MSNDSALYGVAISGGLPRRLSRALTTAACCLLRRSSAALTACRGQRTADLSMPVVAHRPATPAHRPPGAGAGVRSQRRRPEPAWRELKPQRGALSQAQAQIRRVGPAPSRRRPGNASAAQRPTPPRQLSRRGRSILPHPSRRRQPARATAAQYRQARHHMARLRHQRCDATRTRVRPIQARNNSGEYSLSPEGAKPLLSRADLLLSSYQEALPSTPKYPYLYSNYFHELCGAKRARSGLEPMTSCMPSGGSTSTRVHPCRSPSSRVRASPPASG